MKRNLVIVIQVGIDFSYTYYIHTSLIYYIYILKLYISETKLMKTGKNWFLEFSLISENNFYNVHHFYKVLSFGKLRYICMSFFPLFCFS